MILLLFGLGDRVSEGRLLFQKHCSPCHVNGRDDMIPPAPPLEEYVIDSAYAYGVMERGLPEGNMPSFSHLPDDEKGKIAHFLSGINRDTAINTTTEVLLRGQKVYLDVCAPCHGEDGSGAVFEGEGPPPPDFRFFTPLPGRTLEVLEEGIKGSAMYSFRDILKEEDARAVAVYIFSLREKR